MVAEESHQLAIGLNSIPNDQLNGDVLYNGINLIVQYNQPFQL
jgi:hypothetical protein